MHIRPLLHCFVASAALVTARGLDGRSKQPQVGGGSWQNNAVVGGGQDERYRFTVLTDGILRIEWAEDSQFEDRPSSFAYHRNSLTPPDYEVREDDDMLEIITSRFHLTYNKDHFSPHGLTARLVGDESGDWRWGETPDNFGGTIRTVDRMDGQTLMPEDEFVPLEPGILGPQGFTILDDSKSLLFDNETDFVGERRPGNNRRDYYLFAFGNNHREAIRDFYKVSGPVPLLPRWALGNWWSRYYDYTTETYLELMDKFRSEGIPLSVAVIDMGWHLVDHPSVEEAGSSGWTGYTWNREFFPDPPAFLAELHKRNLTTTLNDHPADGVAAHEDVYEEVAEFMDHDTSDGEPVPFDSVDPKYLDSYFNITLKTLEEDGVDFWWVDWQQGAYSKLRGVDPLWMLNHYHWLHQEQRPDVKTPLVFSRFAGPGSHRYPVGFSGDSHTTWKSLEFQPRMTATASNIGYGWWSHDIGGHQQGWRDDDLTVRWVQLGVLSPIFRLHSTQNKWVTKEPWRIMAEPGAIVTRWMQFRHRLIPYLYTMNVLAATRGSPLVQPMYWEYPDARDFENQFLFGNQMMVVPITSPQDEGGSRLGNVEGWLPPGKWVDFFTGMVYRGDRTMWFSRLIDNAPVFMKEGAIVPLDIVSEPANGGANPTGFEVVVVVGADGSFDILEDPDDRTSRSARTNETSDGSESASSHEWDRFPIRYTQESGELTIGPFEAAEHSDNEGASSRSWTVRFLGLSEAESPRVTVGGDSRSIDPHSAENGIIFSLGDVPADAQATINIGGAPELRKNNVTEIIEPVIMEAQTEYDDKNALWDAFEKNESMALKVNSLNGLEMNEALKMFVMEALLADMEEDA